MNKYFIAVYIVFLHFNYLMCNTDIISTLQMIANTINKTSTLHMESTQLNTLYCQGVLLRKNVKLAVWYSEKFQ